MAPVGMPEMVTIVIDSLASLSVNERFTSIFASSKPLPAPVTVESLAKGSDFIPIVVSAVFMLLIKAELSSVSSTDILTLIPAISKLLLAGILM